MPPWAQENLRLLADSINPKLDIYPLAKALWSMISGRNGFQFWDFKSDTNNLEKLFPYDPGMVLVNGILARCIVKEEKDCFYASMEPMQKDVADAITLLNNPGQRSSEGVRGLAASVDVAIIIRPF